MKPMKVAEARAQFGVLLDGAEKGDDVLIERRGVRFRITVERAPAAPASAEPLFAAVDPDVLEGQWTWETKSSGLTFVPRRKRR